MLASSFLFCCMVVLQEPTLESQFAMAKQCKSAARGTRGEARIVALKKSAGCMVFCLGDVGGNRFGKRVCIGLGGPGLGHGGGYSPSRKTPFGSSKTLGSVGGGAQ